MDGTGPTPLPKGKRRVARLGKSPLHDLWRSQPPAIPRWGGTDHDQAPRAAANGYERDSRVARKRALHAVTRQTRAPTGD